MDIWHIMYYLTRNDFLAYFYKKDYAFHNVAFLIWETEKNWLI